MSGSDGESPEGPAERLTEYRRKRSFDRTPEPGGEAEAVPGGEAEAEVAPGGDGGAASEGDGPPRFVIQQHSARRLHWDLRLEHDGVLVSWALPRCVPDDPNQNRLAVHTEDHPLEYLDFHGEIPAGEYGGGSMTIWDRGTYRAEKFRDREVIVRLNGERVQGKYVLFHTDGKNWLMHRMDQPTDLGEPMPESVEPMLAVAGELPEDEASWAFEVDWAGPRVIAYGEPGRLRLVGENEAELGDRKATITRMMRQLGARRTVLDGTVVRSGGGGLTYVMFDLLYLDGRSLLDVPYADRRGELEALGLSGPNWQTPAYQAGDAGDGTGRVGPAMLAAAGQQGLQGIVAKRLDSPYRPGERSEDWRVIRTPPPSE